MYEVHIKQVVEIIEETIIVDDNHAIFRLLSKTDLATYMKIHRFMHTGLIQVIFKSLTLTSLSRSFITALKNERNQN